MNLSKNPVYHLCCCIFENTECNTLLKHYTNIKITEYMINKWKLLGQPSDIITCAYNFYGYCNKDIDCEYVHIKENIPTDCKNYIKYGFCERINCTRLHLNKKSNEICKFYNKYICYKGNLCTFIHIEKKGQKKKIFENNQNNFIYIKNNKKNNLNNLDNKDNLDNQNNQNNLDNQINQNNLILKIKNNKKNNLDNQNNLDDIDNLDNLDNQNNLDNKDNLDNLDNQNNQNNLILKIKNSTWNLEINNIKKRTSSVPPYL